MSDHRSTFLGRADVNDVESILADDAIDFGDLVHTQAVGGDAIFTWDYDRTRPALEKLYEKAKVRQWNANDLPWDTDVDVEAVALEMAGAVAHVRERLTAVDGSPMKTWGDREWTQFAIEAFNFRMSQFLHGEQGALDLHREDRRDRAVDRRQVLRGHAGGRRGPPRRGVREVPRHQARGPLHRQPRAAAPDRRRDRRLALGHDLHGHADHDRRARARGLRLHAHGHAGAAAEAAAALRDGRRGAPRRVRRDLAEGVLHPAVARPRSSSARSSRSRRRSACATGSSCTRSGRRWGSIARRSPGCSSRSAAPAPTRSRPRCSPRSCPTARSSGCSTPATAGCARSSPRSV